MQYICFSLIGIIGGFVNTLLLFQFDNTWKKYLSFSLGNGSFLGLFFILIYNLNINITCHINLLCIYFSSIIITAILTFFYLVSRLKDQTSQKFNINSLDILLGYKDLLKVYYDMKQKEINSILKTDELKAENLKLDNREKMLTDQENQLNKTKDYIEENKQKITHIELPIGNILPLDNVLVRMMPSLIEDYISYTSIITSLTSDFINSYNTHKQKYDFLNGYLFALCSYTAELLFDKQHVDVFFMYFNSVDNMYKPLSYYSKDKFINKNFDELVKIEFIKKICFQKRSIIRSLNPSFFNTSNYDCDEDSIILIFGDFFKNDIPEFYMEISTKYKERYINEFIFLNYCKIENFINDKLVLINEKCNISDTIKKYWEVIINGCNK